MFSTFTFWFTTEKKLVSEGVSTMGQYIFPTVFTLLAKQARDLVRRTTLTLLQESYIQRVYIRFLSFALSLSFTAS